jgi:hypothetical protein
MNNQELEQLISGMPFDESEKKALAGDLAGGLPPEQVLEKTKQLLAAKEVSLQQANPTAAAAHEAADKEYSDAVAKASGEFDTTMAQIDKEADEVGQQMMKKLDEAHAEEIKESIQG